MNHSIQRDVEMVADVSPAVVMNMVVIEKMLQLGTITDANISNRFLMFYQDSTLQALIADAEAIKKRACKGVVP